MMRLKHVVSALAMVALAGSLATAQTPAPPPAPKNLQVLPKTMTTAEVLPIMRAFTGALGVNCGYCHVWTGPGATTNDLAADTKPAKEVARVMMKMATEVNTNLAANIKKPAADITRVQCITCHRGAAIPTVAAAAAPAAPPAAR